MAENGTEVVAKPSLDDRYGKLDPALVELLKGYEFSHFREEIPVPFCGLLIYPVQVRHYEEFAACCSCLTLNKNEDPKGIAMSHLDYLIKKMKEGEPQEAKMWSWRLQRLFELVFKIENGMKCKCGHVIKYDDEAYLEYIKKMSRLFKKIQEHPDEMTADELTEDYSKFCCPKCGSTELINRISIVEDPKTKKSAFSVDGHIINKNDFGKLRQIILFQNYPDYADESHIDPAIKKDHDEKMRIEQQTNDVHATIEKKVIGLTVTTSYKVEEIYNMSIRRFTMMLGTVEDLINYKIMKQATTSGFVTLPKGKSIDHWMYKPIRDVYGDSYKSTEQIQQEVSNL